MTQGLLAPGETLAKMTVEAIVGRGGMGVVYKVRDPKSHIPYAVKVLHPHLLGQRDFVKRFRTEAKTASKFKHINTVHVEKLKGWGGALYYVMEFVDGRPLEEILAERGPFHLDRALRIVRDVAGGLACIHSKGYVHRDVKPGNVLVRPDDHVKLIDFGLAQKFGWAKRTRSGHVMGTAKYMPPELIEGSEVRPFTDVYSLGITAYELLTGAVPFNSDNADVLVDMQLYAKHKPLAAVLGGVDDTLSDFVDRMLAKRPRERIPSAQLVHGWLDFYITTGNFAPLPGSRYP